MGDKSPKGKQKDQKQKAIKDADKEQKRRDKQEKPLPAAGINKKK